MGHDIEIRDRGPNGHVLQCTYISFNWSMYKKYFYIGNIHGHSGRLAAQYIQKALEELAKNGFIPNVNMRVNNWGHTKDKNAWKDLNYERDRLCMFADHLRRFLAFAEEYPDGYWYSDQIWKGVTMYGIEPKLKNNCDDKKFSESGIYFRSSSRKISVQDIRGNEICL